MISRKCFFSQAKVAHDGSQPGVHPGCAQGQDRGQRLRDTGTSVMSRNVCYTVRSHVLTTDPSTKTSISSKRRNIFVRNFQRLLGREFAIDVTGFVQHYIMQVCGNDATFGFQCVIFK